jgi:hypothetical protein
MMNQTAINLMQELVSVIDRINNNIEQLVDGFAKSGQTKDHWKSYSLLSLEYVESTFYISFNRKVIWDSENDQHGLPEKSLHDYLVELMYARSRPNALITEQLLKGISGQQDLLKES